MNSNEHFEEDEVWAQIPGHKNYQISNMGRVLSVRYNRFLTATRLGSDGYFVVSLGRGEVHLIHILVARAFFGEIQEGFEVNHKDGDKSNWKLSNLEVVTPIQNQLHAFQTGLRDRCDGFKHVRIQNVDTGEFFVSISEAARSIGVSPQRVHNSLAHPNQRVRGFRFERAAA